MPTSKCLAFVALVLSITFGFQQAFAQTSDEDSGYRMMYKFTVDDVQSPEVAEEVMNILRSEPFVVSIYFIDEVDCFKITVFREIEYRELKQPLYDEGYQLANTLEAEDGTLLHAESEIHIQR